MGEVRAIDGSRWSRAIHSALVIRWERHRMEDELCVQTMMEEDQRLKKNIKNLVGWPNGLMPTNYRETREMMEEDLSLMMDIATILIPGGDPHG